MIKIINGTYGYRNSDGRVEAKTPKSKPFSLLPRNARPNLLTPVLLNM